MYRIHPSVYEKADPALLELIEKAKVGNLSEEEYLRYEAGLKALEDYIDFDEKSSPIDTTRVQMQDRICLQFNIKSIHMELLPEIETAVLNFLNTNPALQKSYDTYLPNLRNEVAFNHTQAVKLDSLTSQYYFHNNFEGKKMSGVSEGVAFVMPEEP